MEKEKIDWSLLTPEAAYKRITEFATKLAQNYPKPSFTTTHMYRFDFDKNSVYMFLNESPINGDFIFIRQKDAELARMTKYSFLPQDQPTKI